MSRLRFWISLQSSGYRLVLTLTLLLTSHASLADDQQIRLRDTCPPGFEKINNQCFLRNLYQMYDSLQNQGVGGLKTGLPDYRDGFSPQQIDLGRYLFFDPLLSKNQDMSCASCHQPDKGFSDGLPRSIGADNRELNRAAPTIWNTAFLQSFFWDGHAKSFEEQAQAPLFSEVEMANSPEQLLTTLRADVQYQRLFAVAFPAHKNIELENLYFALAAFQASLISLNSRYDQYAHGFHKALNQNEIDGLNIFRSFVARCAECHTPPLFTNQQIAVIGAADPEGLPFDPGAQIPLNDPLFRGGFKVPTLRNISLTAPYMHSGKFDNLKDTARFYTKGRGHDIPPGEAVYLHWHIWEPKLTEQELDRLVDFLQTLTDQNFLPESPRVLPSGLEPVH